MHDRRRIYQILLDSLLNNVWSKFKKIFRILKRRENKPVIISPEENILQLFTVNIPV